MLPDTFGTTQFLKEAPEWAADWTGQRMDSKNPFVAGDEYIEWLKARSRNPLEKLIIASDTLDVDDILGLHAYFGGTLAGATKVTDFHSAGDFLDRGKWTPGRRARFSAGWGTLLTNDFRGCDPAGGRPAGGQAFRQLLEGARPSFRNRTLPPRVRHGGSEPCSCDRLTAHSLITLSRARQFLPEAKNSGASLRPTDGDTWPYVVRGEAGA
jgi:hypothetical protein